MPHTCPWWLTPLFDNPLRRLIQPAERTLEPLVWEGQRVVDLGCGMGYFALAAARLVGPTGVVHAVDTQQRSLDRLRRRAKAAGLDDRIRTHCQDAAALELPEPVDAAYAIWAIHEIGAREELARRLVGLLPSGGRLLIVEPLIHVSERSFVAIVDAFMDAGFLPGVRVSGGMSRGLILAAP